MVLRILDSIARDRNIDRELLIEDLEQAMVSAARKHFNSLDTEEFGCNMDRLTGVIRLWRQDEEGLEEDIPLESMGRIPAQTAKQVMIQRFREDERASPCVHTVTVRSPAWHRRARRTRGVDRTVLRVWKAAFRCLQLRTSPTRLA